MSSSASGGEDEPPEGERGVLSVRQALAALTAETVGIGGALWGAKDFLLPPTERDQLLVFYLAIFALSAAIAFALVKLDRRVKLWGALVSGGVALSLFCTLVIVAAIDSRPSAAVKVDSAAPPAVPTQTPAAVAPTSPVPAPTSTRPAPPSPRSAPPSENAAASCQQRARYRVTAHGDIVDKNKTTIGQVDEGDMFVVLDEPVHVDFRRYGTVGNGGLTGYVLMTKLEPAGTVCV
jgi:hypothetical protein